MSTIVTTQAELDSALAAGAEGIIIASPAGVWLNVSGSATVVASGSATVRAYDSATVAASGSATVRAFGSATVVAYDSATVRASGSATVRAYGSATVRAYGSATVTASAHVAVHIHSAHVVATGGVIIDVPGLDLSDAVSWCAHHGVEVVDGVATVYKAVDDAWTTSRGTDYSPGSLPTALDWRDDHKHGGGLHFSPWPWQALEYHPGATRFVAVGVAIETLRPLVDGTPQCKVPHVVVACREVTIDGAEVSS